MASRGVRAYYPEYGSVRTLLLVAGLLAAAGLVAPAVAAAVAADAAETVASVLYAVVLFVAGVAIAVEVKRQRTANPREFSARDVLVAFYEQQRPSPLAHLAHAVGVLAGGLLVWRAGTPTLARLDGAVLVLERLAAGEPLPAIDPVAVAWGLAWLAGAVVLAVGLDRFLVGVYRELRYQHAVRRAA